MHEPPTPKSHPRHNTHLPSPIQPVGESAVKSANGLSNTNPLAERVAASHGTEGSSSPKTMSPSNYRPLNVSDALTYLDQVKREFSDRLDVYNQFLDIMKDFKSQAIDTPGVIERVSSLFKGHPTLISGFNTFLPPGYRIECSVDEYGRDIIKVMTPSGTICSVGDEILKLPADPFDTTTQHASPYIIRHDDMEATPTGPSSSYAFQQKDAHRDRRTSLVEGETDRRPVEFNHAINYVNKIKNYFASEPDIYKQFLEILQTYQKEQRPIEDVYKQVSILFNGSRQLLDEFKQFLPDISNDHADDPGLSYSYTRNDVRIGPLDPLRKKRQSTSQLRDTKRPKLQYRPSLEGHNELPLADDSQSIVSRDQVDFFDQVKRYIGNKVTYDAFVKVVLLYRQQMIDRDALMDRVDRFIGSNKDLLDKFESLIGFNGIDQIVENAPAELVKADVLPSRKYGPSYRPVPKLWQKQHCSGREKDALCKAVFNDKYVSHPTWASEDSGFVSSKKNQFEEALHRVEDERYEYDLNIEANLNTIALLEPIAKKLSLMSEEEKQKYILPVGLGGPSKTIYQTVIQKVYGKERGTEVIALLHGKPAQTVPVLLKRLKQRDEKWRQDQREWNLIWREIEAKNYYRALDYQGITFKSSDKKILSVKTLVAEIEALRLEQTQGPRTSSTPQIDHELGDPSVFKDISRVFSSFLDRQTHFTPHDCEAMRKMFTLLVLSFFRGDESPIDGRRRGSASSAVAVDTRRGLGVTLERKHIPIHLFGNDSFYCFLRLYQIAYCRLETFKKLNADYAFDPESTKRETKAAIDFTLSKKDFGTIELDFHRSYYRSLFPLFEQLFEREIDQQMYEECLRYIFGTKAYLLFTINWLFMAIARQVHIMATDNKCHQLMNIFQKSKAITSGQRDGNLTTYWFEVEKITSREENMYHLSYNPNNRHLTMELVDYDEMAAGPKENYNNYLESYMDWSSETKGIRKLDLSKCFLQRNLRRNMDPADMCGEDMYIHGHRPSSPLVTAAMKDRWTQWLESDGGWGRGVNDRSTKETDARRLFEPPDDA